MATRSSTLRADRLSTRHAGLSTNHHLYLSAFPGAVEAWDFSGFDAVVSFSSAFTHGIITNCAPRHLCYVHSPARYLWDRTHDVLARAGQRPLGPLKRWHLSRTFHKLRIWDSEAADRPDMLLAASKTVQRRIELYWRRESDVLYPPVNDSWLREESSKMQERSKPAPYFLIVSTLVPYKRIELAIEACNALQTPLTIAGDGPARAHLQSIAGPTVRFVGYQTDAQLRELYTRARATIFPGEEDFGLVPLESLACGTPVIAYRGGGALETLTDKTAAFFDEPTSASLRDTLRTWDSTSFQETDCRQRAEHFSQAQFKAGLHKALETLLQN